VSLDLEVILSMIAVLVPQLKSRKLAIPSCSPTRSVTAPYHNFFMPKRHSFPLGRDCHRGFTAHKSPHTNHHTLPPQPLSQAVAHGDPAARPA
jgi:hypothetical protein